MLCPSRLLDTGTVSLNNMLQTALNPDTGKKAQLSFKGIYFRVGDKVMQTKNNYDLQYKRDGGEYGTGVFNGDVGFITDIDKRGGIMTVRYDDRTVTYFSEDLSELEPAYAVTVHKSQGASTIALCCRFMMCRRSCATAICFILRSQGRKAACGCGG